MDNKEDVRTLFRILHTEAAICFPRAYECACITLGVSDNKNYNVGSHILCIYVLILCIKGLHAQIRY